MPPFGRLWQHHWVVLFCLHRNESREPQLPDACPATQSTPAEMLHPEQPLCRMSRPTIMFVAALCRCEQLQKTLPTCDYRHILAPIAERSSGAGRAQRADRQSGLGNKMSSRAEVATESWFEECVATLGEVHDENVYAAIERLVEAGSEVGFTVADLIRMLKTGMTLESLLDLIEIRMAAARPSTYSWAA
jgi:hypothetical protein